MTVRGALVVSGALVAALAAVNAPAAASDGGYTVSLIQTGQEAFTTAVNAETDTTYFGDTLADAITVVNGATDAVTATISLAGSPRGIAVNPVTDTLYVTLAAASTASGPSLDVIDGSSNTVMDTIAIPAVNPVSVAVDSLTDMIYLADAGSAEVTVIDGTTDTVADTISTGTGTAPVGVTVDEASDDIWVADESGNVLDISGATNSVIQKISLNGAIMESVSVDPTTDTVYAVAEEQGLAVIDGSSGAITKQIAVSAPAFAVAADPESGIVFVSSFDGGVGFGTTWIVDAATNAVIDTIDRGGLQIAADTATGSMFASAFNRQSGGWRFTPSATDAVSPEITTKSASFLAGRAGSVTLTASAEPAATFSESGSLPAGLTLSPAGVLSGTPAAGTGGLYQITVTASNGIAPDYSSQINLTVYEAPTISVGISTATLQAGTSYSFPITVTGYPAPSVIANSPEPLTITKTATPGLFELSGTPTASQGGVYAPTFEAFNDFGAAFSSTVTLTVDAPPLFGALGPLTVRTGQTINFVTPFTGYPGPTITETGRLPAGLHLDPGGLLWGTPGSRAGGVYPITMHATNGIAPDASGALAITVDQPPAFTTARSATFRRGTKASFTFRTSAYPAAHLTERGSLPAGVRFRAGANGTATLTGKLPGNDRLKTWTITITATNSIGAPVRQTFTLKVIR